MEKILDDVDTRVRAACLFDRYGVLLKDNARDIFEEYFADDLSLSEVAEHAGITRQGVHDSIRRSFNQLEEYEAKLHLLTRHEEAEDTLAKLECMQSVNGDSESLALVHRLDSLV